VIRHQKHNIVVKTLNPSKPDEVLRRALERKEGQKNIYIQRLLNHGLLKIRGDMSHFQDCW